MLKIKIALLILLFSALAVADVSGGFSNAGSFGAAPSSTSSTGGNNFGSSAGGSTSSGSGSGTGTTISVGGGSTQMLAPGQTQITNTGDQQQNKDLVNGYRKDEYNSYLGLMNGQNITTLNGTTSAIMTPDEFQISVGLRTGLMLPRYGYDLFGSGGTFSPSNSAPPNSNYIIGPGDQIAIKAWGAVEVDYMAIVDTDGSIYIPKVGKINITGVRVGDLDQFLKDKIGRVYRNFTLTANVSQVKSIQITVSGMAKKAGTYTISSLSTLTNAVFASGGPSNQGSLRHIQLKRRGVVVADYDMYDLLLKGDDSKDVRLMDGDIVYIKPHGIQVAIYDGVKVPAIYETKDNETIANVVMFAGGYTFDNTKQQIIVERIEDRNKIDVYNYTFESGLKQTMNNGEIIHFFKMPNRYNDAITLIGNIANPSRFAWHEGITIRDIIPNKNQLLTKSFWNSYSQNTMAKDRMKEENGVEKTSNSSGANSQSNYSSGFNSTTDSSANNRQQPQGVFGGGDNLFTAGPLSIPEADINWHYAVVIRLDPVTYRSILIPFDLEAAIKGESSANLELKPGDVINILSSKDVRNPARKGVVYVFVDGEVNRPGVFELEPGTNLIDAIKTAGGITSDAYLYGTELDREAVKKRQKAALDQMLDNVQQSILAQATNNTQSSVGPNSLNNSAAILSQQQAFIDKLKQIKPNGRVVLSLDNNKVTLENMPKIGLENGDTIYIPPIPTTIDVIGQVYNPATFVFEPKYTLGDYINRAGTTNDFADNGSIYLLRADGTLYSKQQAGWFGAFNSKHLYAGDAIIVPQQIKFSTLTANLIDWTTILANFGLGLAAIKQLGQ